MSAVTIFCDQLISGLVDGAIASPDNREFYAQLIGHIIIMSHTVLNPSDINDMVEQYLIKESAKYEDDESESSDFRQSLEAIKNRPHQISIFKEYLKNHFGI